MANARTIAKVLVNALGQFRSAGIENQPYMQGRTIVLDGSEAGFPTYTPLANVRALFVEVIGAGGGGGAADGDGTNTGIAGSGGGGGFAQAFITSVAASYTYAIGAGGAGGTGTATGSTGGTSSITDGSITVQATGGQGGNGVNATGSSAGYCGIGGQGSLTGVSGRIGGGVQGPPFDWHNASSTTCYSTRGHCPIVGTDTNVGYGANGVASNGSDGTVVGQGGAGGFNSATTTSRSGGNGYRGEIRITEYY